LEGDDDATSSTGAPETGRRRAEPATTAQPTAASVRLKEALGRPDANQAGRDVVGALMAQPSPPAPIPPAPAPAAPVVETVPATEPKAAKAPRARTLPPPATPRAKRQRPKRAARQPERPPAPTGGSTSVRFPPKRGARRFMATVLLIVLVATGGAAYLAYDDPTTLSVGVAATLGVLLLVVWAIRAGTPLTRMAVKGGQLEVRQGGLHLKFDLASRYTPIEVQGVPGRRGWRVLFGRGTMAPFVVDASIVDPKTFMEVLSSYRPE
jgi:hypothetical protein